MVVNKSPMSKACLEYIHLKQNKKTPRTLTNSLNLKYIANRYICLRRRRKKMRREKGKERERLLLGLYLLKTFSSHGQSQWFKTV